MSTQAREMRWQLGDGDLDPMVGVESSVDRPKEFEMSVLAKAASRGEEEENDLERQVK
jgi:hypothetical protein